MQRCRSCEATLTKEESEAACANCGASNKPKSESGGNRQRIRTLITYFFFLSAIVSLVSLLTPWGPPFITSMCVTFVLLLVKSSADEMLADQDR